MIELEYSIVWCLGGAGDRVNQFPSSWWHCLGYLLMAASPVKQREELEWRINAFLYLQAVPLIHRWQTTLICLDFIVWLNTEMCSRGYLFLNLLSAHT